MNARPDLPDLAAIPRRKKPDRGATGRAAPRRVLTSIEVEVETFNPVTRAIDVHRETAEAYVRDVPAVLAAMPAPLREAALAYAKAVEDVEAGGAADPAAKVAKGSPAVRKEGRQFHAIRQVEHLRRIEAAVGPGSVCLGCRQGEIATVTIGRLAILRAVALDGLSVAGLLASLRLGRSAVRQRVVLAALLGAAQAAAEALGLVDPIEKVNLSKKKD